MMWYILIYFNNITLSLHDEYDIGTLNTEISWYLQYPASMWFFPDYKKIKLILDIDTVKLKG